MACRFVWLNASFSITATIGVDDFLVGDRAVARDARLGVLFVLAAQAHQQVRDGLAEQVVLFLAARLQFGEFLHARLFQFAGLGAQAVGLGVIERPHVGFGDRVIARSTLFSPQPAQAPSPETSAS